MGINFTRGAQKTKFLIVFNRPLSHSEINYKLNLSYNNSIKLREWLTRKIIQCKTPNITKGRIFDLTIKGKRLRRLLLKNLPNDRVINILHSANSSWDYISPPKNLDYFKYAKVVASPHLKTQLLEILCDTWQRAVDEYIGRGINSRLIPGIYTRVKEKNLPVNWSNLIDGLKEMIQLNLIEIKSEDSRKNYFKLSDDGIIIKNWIHKIRRIEMNYPQQKFLSF